MEARLSTIVLSLTLFYTCAAQDKPPCGDELPHKPEVIRTTEGSNATFAWQTKQAVGKYKIISCKYNLTPVVDFYSSESLLLPIGLYRDRVFGVIAGNEFSFNLTSVTEEDARYQYILDLGLPTGTVCEENVSLSIYKKPTDPIIVVFEPSTLNQGYTVTCKANSTSIPADLRLPVEYTWKAEKGSMDVGYTVTGEYNETLSLFSPDVNTDHDIDVTCVAREQGSPLDSRETKHIDIPGIDSGSNGTESGQSGDDIPTMGVLDGYSLIIIILSVTGLILVAMASIVGYLCWERKHKPDRSRRRNKQIRQSLTLSGLRRGRSHQGLSVDFDAEPEIYQSIRNSAIRSTLDTNKVPTLPKRPSPLGAGDGSYDYADPDRLGLAARCDPKSSKRLLADGKDDPEDFSYGSAIDLDGNIRKDVDLYMGDVANPGAPPKPAVYSVVNKPQTGDGDETETSIIDNDAYHSAFGGNAESPLEGATPGMPPPPSCGKRNSYVVSPTRNRDAHKPSPAPGDPAVGVVRPTTQPGGPGTRTDPGDTELYCLAKSPDAPRTKKHRHSSGDKALEQFANNDIYGLATIDSGVQTQPLQCSPNDIYQMATCVQVGGGEDGQDNISEDDDHDLKIVDNDSYVPC